MVDLKETMISPWLMDYHLHTAVTIDGRMTEDQACEKAISMGIDEIAFTNHVMLTQPDYRISPDAFVTHWENIEACQHKYPELSIRLGIEMDYYLDREAEIEQVLRSYESLIGRPFDIVLGSVHEVSGNFFSNKHLAAPFYANNDLVRLYEQYFELAERAALSGLFDVIAHPDLIKKYTYELTPRLPFDAYRAGAERFVEAAVLSGTGLEVNTKGLKLLVGEAYPSDELLKAYLCEAKQSGVRPIITLGSDAHKPEDVGYKIADVASHLAGMGIQQLAHFEDRSLAYRQLPEKL